MPKPSIPAFCLERQIKNMKTQLMATLTNVVNCQQFIGGQFIKNFEQQLANYLDVKHVISCNSGTDALWMALRALDMPKRAIVLTTPFSFIASSSEIVSNSAHPVFIDIQEETFNIDPQLVATWLDQNATQTNGATTHKKTGFPIVGLLPVDLFGQCADYPTLQKIADEWNLWIVEDCAQAIGARFNNQKAGTFGEIGTFSFYPTKNLGAFGDAGCCATNDPVLAEKLLQLRNHGRSSHYHYNGSGINSRMDALQAAVLSEKLPHLDALNKRRHNIAQRYNKQFKDVTWLKTPQSKNGFHVYHQYSILLDDNKGVGREEFQKHLTDKGIQTRIFYPEPLPTIDFLKTHPELETSCPVANHAAKNIVSLPMWPELEDSEVDYVIECVKEIDRLSAQNYHKRNSIITRSP